MSRTRLVALLLLAVFLQACGHWPLRNLRERRERRAEERASEATREREPERLVLHGVESDPAIEAARAELEATRAREKSGAVVDGVELRVGAEIEGDTSVDVLARLPLANPRVVRAERKAQLAASDAAQAKLEGVTLERRAARCLPALDAQVHAQRVQIYDRYASRQRALLDFSNELGRAGLQDEIDTTAFQLASQVSLATRTPEPPPPSLAPADVSFGVLPELPVRAARLRGAPEFVRAAVSESQPALGVHRALEARYRALAQREQASRLPSLKFVDLGFEPVAHRGQQQAVIGRIGLEIPFGRRSRAEAQHYSALAQHETSRGRVATDERVEQALRALAQLQSLHDRSAHLRELLALADSAEAVADRWFRERLASPKDIAGLLDEVFRTRSAALDARERAGLADCSLLAATGATAASWPRE